MSDGQSHASDAANAAEERALKAYGHMGDEELVALLTAKRAEATALRGQEHEIAERRRKAEREAADMERVWWARGATS